MAAKLVSSSYVRSKLDPHRPKYSEAVKSLEVFCERSKNPELAFKVLVTHLDDACAEAVNSVAVDCGYE